MTTDPGFPNITDAQLMDTTNQACRVSECDPASLNDYNAPFLAASSHMPQSTIVRRRR